MNNSHSREQAKSASDKSDDAMFPPKVFLVLFVSAHGTPQHSTLMRSEISSHGESVYGTPQRSTLMHSEISSQGGVFRGQHNDLCESNIAFIGGGQSEQGDCMIFSHCQAICAGDNTCKGFNWFPQNGSCRTFSGTFTPIYNTPYPVIAGKGYCYPPSIPLTPECAHCPNIACRQTGGSQMDMCTMDTAFDAINGGSTQWRGNCMTLSQCQAQCDPDKSICRGFNWWPTRGGCRTNHGSFAPRQTAWTTLGGQPWCSPPTTIAPGSHYVNTPQCDQCPDVQGCRNVMDAEDSNDAPSSG